MLGLFLFLSSASSFPLLHFVRRKPHLSLLLGLSPSSTEQLQAIDGSSNTAIIGEGVRRREGRLHNLPHRATYVIVLRPSDGKFYVQRRSTIKDYCPGYLDPTTGGCVAVGESYRQNAGREVKEEIGLDVGEVDGGKVSARVSVCCCYCCRSDHVRSPS